MVSIEEIRSALHKQQFEPMPFKATSSWASVAMIFAGEGSSMELLFIKRAEREGDPWSGHVAFPGGRASAGDPDPAAVAERETWEEIGLRLKNGNRIGALADMPVRREDLRMSMTLSTHVYHVGAERPQVMPNHEVADIFWVPLTHLFDASATTTVEFVRDGTPLSFPGVQLGDYILWGLTLRVMAEFAKCLEQPLPSLPE